MGENDRIDFLFLWVQMSTFVAFRNTLCCIIVSRDVCMRLNAFLNTQDSYTITWNLS